MPLTLAIPDVEYLVLRIAVDDNARRHLAAMGLIAGVTVVLLSRFMGNFILRIGDTKIGLSQETARRIIIQEKK